MPGPDDRREGRTAATAPLSVVIVGGGFAALEAALGLRALVADAVRLTFVAPEPILRYRPAATTELAEVRPPRTYDLRAVAAQLGATIHLARVDAVAPAVAQLRLSSGVRLTYDVLVLAIGSRRLPSVAGATIFRDQRDLPALRRVMAGLESRQIEKLVFAVPSGTSWPLPLYELALLAARRAARWGGEVSLVSPEREPLEIFGVRNSRRVAGLLDELGVRFWGGCTPMGVRRDGAVELAGGGTLAADRVITVPQLGAHRVSGIPARWWGFVPTDRCGRVLGIDHVYAAGDMTAFPVKHGGLATQQADRVAHAIAQRLGHPVKALDQRLVLQAHLVGGPSALYLRTELDWEGRPTTAGTSYVEQPDVATSAKVLGRYLTPYLEQFDAASREESVILRSTSAPAPR